MTDAVWPEWLTPEYSAIHTAIENEIKKALQHCYDSADAAGMDWTTEGWISCSASNIMGWMKQQGLEAPDVGNVENFPMPREYMWDLPDYEEEVCPTCDGSGAVEIQEDVQT